MEDKTNISWQIVVKKSLILGISGLFLTSQISLITSCSTPTSENLNKRGLQESNNEITELSTPSEPVEECRKEIDIPVEIETAKIIALEYAKMHPLIDFEPEYVSSSTIEHPYFNDYHFVYVWGLWGHEINSAIAISPQGDAFKLPEEFNQLAQDQGLVLHQSKEAKALLDFYLTLDIVWPGFDSHIILEEISDIPGFDEDHISEYLNNVTPLKILTQPDGWKFDFFTWRAVGGVLFQWEVFISEIGELEVRSRKQLEIGIGDLIWLE